jgi:hypothetical protein
MSIRVDYHQAIGVIQISSDGQFVFIRRDQAAELLAKFMGVLADSIPDLEDETNPEHPGFSRKVPDTPALRLVGGFACDPDESCGAA